MAELLIRAANVTNVDPTKDARGCYKRGYPVIAMEDGHAWGAEERLPKFVVFKFPMISVATLVKYIQPWKDVSGEIVNRRLWRVRWVDLPVSAQNKLVSNGEITIKATADYTGTFDYTWSQVKTYFRNQLTNLDEIADLSVTPA